MERLLRVVQIGKNPTKGAPKGSLSRGDTVSEAYKADQGAVLQLLHTCHSSTWLTAGSATRRRSCIYETGAVIKAGFKPSLNQ